MKTLNICMVSILIALLFVAFISRDEEKCDRIRPEMAE